MPLIIILDADDVVFAKIGAGLDFDQLKRDLPLIGKPVRLANRDIDGLVFRQQPGFVANRYRCGALDDDPVLRAVIVFLERDAVAGSTVMWPTR